MARGDVDNRLYAAVRPCIAVGVEENGLAVPHLARVERTLPLSALMLGKIIIQFRGGGGVMARRSGESQIVGRSMAME